MTPAERKAIERVRAWSPPDNHDARIVFAALDKAEEEIARLREALGPFANLGVTSGPDDEPCSIPYRITRGSIRKARAALSPKDGAGE